MAKCCQLQERKEDPGPESVGARSSTEALQDGESSSKESARRGRSRMWTNRKYGVSALESSPSTIGEICTICGHLFDMF